MSEGNNGDGIARRRLLLLYCYYDCDDFGHNYLLQSCDTEEDDTWNKSKMLGLLATLIPNAGRRVLQKGVIYLQISDI